MSDDLHPGPAAHQPRRRRHRPAVLLPRARRLPRRRRDRPVRLHAHAHGLPAPLPAQVLGARGGRRPARDPAPDPARALSAPLERQPARDRVAGRHPGRHGPRLVGRVHRLPAQGARDRRPISRRRRRRSPKRPATSRSTCSASRSASRISTPRRTAASAPTRSTRTTRVDGRAAQARRSETSSGFADHLLLFYTGETRSASEMLLRPGSRARGSWTRRCSTTSTAPRRSASRAARCSRRGDLDATPS